MEIWSLLLDIVILLTGSLTLGAICSRLGQSPLIGYLIAGMLLGGPGSLNLISSEKEIEQIAELGVSLLLFSLGLEFSFERLLKLGGRRLWSGIIQVLSTLLIVSGTTTLSGFSLREALVLGAMISLSSTAIVLRILMERGELETHHGRNSLAILLVQDVAVIPLAILVALLGHEPNATASVWWKLVQLLGGAILLSALLYVILNFGARWVLASLSHERNRELAYIMAVLIGLGSAWAAHAVGISPALGAFIAGMILGSSTFAMQIRADISSLRILLLTLFFGSAGMIGDPRWMLQNVFSVLAATFALLLLKFLVLWLLFLWIDRRTHVAFATAFCLSQVGEFAFVLSTIARNNQALSEESQKLASSVTIVSLLLAPFIVAHAERLAQRLSRRQGISTVMNQDQASLKPDELSALIIGFGPAGRLAAQALENTAIQVTILDLNAEGVRQAAQLGFRSFIGDATQPEVLEHLNIGCAQIVIVTVPHLGTALKIVQLVQSLAPLAHLIVRSRHQCDTHDFIEAGVDAVVGDEEEVGRAIQQEIRHWQEESPATVLPESGTVSGASLSPRSS